MGLLLLQDCARHKDREVAVLDSQLLDSFVQPVTDVLPDRERPGTQNVAATHVIVLDHLSFSDYLNMQTDIKWLFEVLIGFKPFVVARRKL